MPAPDFTRHNEEVAQVWSAYRAGRPLRVPFANFTIGPRIWVLDPRLNDLGVTWEQMSNDPETMFQVYLRYKHYLVHNIPHDIEMGVPSEGKTWEIGTEFVNVFEEGWLGCPIIYPENQVTASLPAYRGDKKRDILERGIPDPFGGFNARVREYYEYFLDRAASYEFHGRGISVYPPCPLATGGPFTVAVGVRGHELLEDMLVDEDYYHQLMTFIVDATVARIRAWRAYLGMELRPRDGGFGDDAIQFLSVRQYREKVLPYHLRLKDALYQPGGAFAMHLCGNVQRLLPTLVTELGATCFDTGYPIKWETLREDVGEEVEIMGGVPVTDLMAAAPEAIYEKARAILQSGIMRAGRYIMKEGNNVPPAMPLANLAAMYAAAKRFGVYQY